MIYFENALFRLDALSLTMAGVILFITAIIHGYSRRYMQGDAQQSSHQGFILFTSFFMLMMVISNHLVIFGLCWAMANLLLGRLMMHKQQWQAAANSAKLTFWSLGAGTISLWAALGLLYTKTGDWQISTLLANSAALETVLPAVVPLLLLAAICQSALWPMHRWLLSSLNSPTPVSAFMHAGLINGGGYLMVKFAPLLLAQPLAMHALFILGVASFLMATFWKLIQTDIKRMLACSTMAQMGYMLMQCAVGLFPAAIAHLCWHGLFKANLFLNAGSAINQHQHNHLAAPKHHIAMALGFGLLGSVVFSLLMQIEPQMLTTELLLSAFATLAIAQVVITLLRRFSLGKALALSVLAAPIAGAVYAASLLLIETALAPLALHQPIALNPLHYAGVALGVAAWLWMNRFDATRPASARYARYYMQALNASQPHPDTITALRRDYRFQ